MHVHVNTEPVIAHLDIYPVHTVFESRLHKLPSYKSTLKPVRQMNAKTAFSHTFFLHSEAVKHPSQGTIHPFSATYQKAAWAKPCFPLPDSSDSLPEPF